MNVTRGFTLIELLVVILVIGILATIAIPKYQKVKSKGFVAKAESDLRILITAQESYFVENETYASFADLITGSRYTPSSGITVTVADVTVSGWSATAVHAGFIGLTACGVYVGTATSPNAAIPSSGQVACW
jgi:prepilin-type N-terminal cleavage/methylation domain-containing protein